MQGGSLLEQLHCSLEQHYLGCNHAALLLRKAVGAANEATTDTVAQHRFLQRSSIAVTPVCFALCSFYAVHEDTTVMTRATQSVCKREVVT